MSVMGAAYELCIVIWSHILIQKEREKQNTCRKNPEKKWEWNEKHSLGKWGTEVTRKSQNAIGSMGVREDFLGEVTAKLIP